VNLAPLHSSLVKDPAPPDEKPPKLALGEFTTDVGRAPVSIPQPGPRCQLPPRVARARASRRGRGTRAPTASGCQGRPRGSSPRRAPQASAYHLANRLVKVAPGPRPPSLSEPGALANLTLCLSR
jgi:hypothetical protein